MWSLLAPAVPDSDAYQPGTSEWQLADALLAGGAPNEALRAMAHAFSNREAVWWACQCCHLVSPPGQGTDEAAAFRAAEEWVQYPEEATAANATVAAAATAYDSPWALAAAAAAEATEEPRPPADDVSAEYAWGAVMRILLLVGEPKRFAKHAGEAMDLGWEIVDGTRPFPR